ncbi:MAG: hypothetical protein CML06_00795 [Pseudomonadales bacterium]|nr:hypothetical protein [Pseudomonadales bacterium]
MKLFVCNHAYHLQKAMTVLSWNDYILFIGNDSRLEPKKLKDRMLQINLFEELPIHKKVWFHIQFLFLILKLRRLNIRAAYFFGAQDLISWKLLKHGIFDECKVIPDNLEFYLRPQLPLVKKFQAEKDTLRKSLKVLLYCGLSDKNAFQVASFGSRLLYSIKEVELEDSLAFYSSSNIPHIDREAYPGSIFISQPYYLDYSIDIVLWANRIHSILVQRGCNYIKFHQRDSPKFRDIMKELGYSERDPRHYAKLGIFSTYLFEAALSGDTVESIAGLLIDLFPASYKDFVLWMSSYFNVSIDGTAKRWTIHREQFNKLNALVT